METKLCVLRVCETFLCGVCVVLLVIICGQEEHDAAMEELKKEHTSLLAKLVAYQQ